MHTSGEANLRRTLDNFRVPYGITFTQLAPREFGSVWSGILCGECGGRGCERRKYSITCSVCGKDEMLGSVILRHAVELRYLFYNNPEMVTAGNIFALMGGVISIKTIRRHLATRFPLVRQSNTHFYQINIWELGQLSNSVRYRCENFERVPLKSHDLCAFAERVLFEWI